MMILFNRVIIELVFARAAACRAENRAPSTTAARIAITATVISSSMSVNPLRPAGVVRFDLLTHQEEPTVDQ